MIENGRIREIRTDRSVPAAGGATEIDLRGAYLMPGLWDVHIHPDYYSLAEMPLVDQVTLSKGGSSRVRSRRRSASLLTGPWFRAAKP